MRMSDLKEGMEVLTDAGFTCMGAGRKTVKVSDNGEFYVSCREGQHFLDAQTNTDGDLIGISAAAE